MEFIIRPNKIVVVIDVDTYTVGRDQPHYEDVVQAVRDKDYDRVAELVKPEIRVIRSLDGFPDFALEDRQVYYKGNTIPRSLSERLVYMIDEGFDATPLINFYRNLDLNPSHRAVTELFRFLDACDLPITEDGHFLAYKRVRSDFKDVRSGTFDNSPGRVVSMPRNQVDEDSERTCSQGLHVCSQSYLGCYPGEMIIQVKVNPRDVVAVPRDYNDSKMRVCRYEVIKPVTDGGIRSHFVPDEVDFDSDMDLDGMDLDEFDPQDFDAVPAGYNWIAMDLDGRAHAFVDEPHWDGYEWVPRGGDWEEVRQHDNYADDAETSLVKLGLGEAL